MGVEGGSVLIPSRAQILEKLMRHVYFKQYFTRDEFKKGKHQISSYLALLKINTSSINLALPINLCHPASNYSNFSAPSPPPAEKTCLTYLVSLTQMNLSYFKTTGQDTHTVKIQHGKME